VKGSPTHTTIFQQWLLITGILLLLPFTAFSSQFGTALPKISASVEKTTARVGDLLWLNLTYEMPEGTKLAEKAAIKGLDTVTVVEQTSQPGTIRIRFLVDRLESFKLGPFGLTCIDSSGKEHQIETDPIAMTIESNLGKKPEEASLKPIQDIMPTESKWLLYLLAACAIIILLGVVSGLMWWSRKRRTDTVKATMEDPPHVRAEKEIARLLASGLFEKGEVKTFYFSFSETVRRYMGAIRHFPAAEMTTEEILRHAATHSDDQAVVHLLRGADLVKFADAVPNPDRKEKDVTAVRDYIRQTAPEPDTASNTRPETEDVQ